MRTWKKVLAFVLALTMVIGMAAPVALADTTNVPHSYEQGIFTKEVPATTEVNIYKLKADGFNSDVPVNHDLTKLDLTKDLKPLGKNVEYFDGVSFTYYKVTKEQLDAMVAKPGKYDTKEKVEAEFKNLVNQGTTTDPTKNGGHTTVSLGTGYYWFVENPYTPKSGKASISSAKAVPFGISLPYTNLLPVKEGQKTHEPGTGYLNKIYIYPKNVVGDEPEIEKDVKELKNKTATYNVGESHPWAIHTTVPANIKDYKTFTISDTIDKRLDYVGKVVVAYGNYTNMAAVKAAATGVKLEKGTDYTLTEPTVNAAGGQLEVKLTAAGIAKLGEKYDVNSKLYVYFETKINDKATMGKPIPNDAKLTFNNGQGGDKTKKPDTPPVVVTGGRRFIKVDSKENAKKLAGAVFELYDGDTKLTWTEDLLKANNAAIEAGNFATNADGKPSTATDKPKAGDPILLLSKDGGTFEIKGLAFSNDYSVTVERDSTSGEVTVKSVTIGNTKLHDYKIKEVKAPKDYALPSGDDAFTTFTVEPNSYWKDPLAANLVASGAQELKNTKLTIPQTGGMGTVLFTVVGLALMGGAFVAFRKNKKAYEEAE